MATYTKEECITNFTISGLTAGRKLGYGSYRQYNSTYYWRLHTAPSGTASLDELWTWVYRCNYTISLEMGWGNTTTSGSSNMTTMYFPTNSGNWLVSSGVLMQDSDNVYWQSGSVNYNWCNAYINRLTY